MSSEQRSAVVWLALALGLAGCGDGHNTPPGAAPARSLSPTPPACVAPVVAASAATAASAPAAMPAAPQARETAHGVLLHAVAATNMQPPFVVCTDPAAAVGIGIEVPPGAGTTPGALCLPYAVKKTGPYAIWIRALWGTDGEDACSNSIYVQPDGAPRVLVQDATYRQWHWVRARFPGAREGWVQLTEGAHQLRLESREDGIRIDQIYIIPWYPSEMDCYVPQDIEE